MKGVCCIFATSFKEEAMDSKRQMKFARLIQKDLSDIFQKESNDLFGGLFISVTHVKVTPDMSMVRVYLSFLLTKNKKQAMMLVNEHAIQIRHMLAQRIRHQVRKIPEIAFYMDDTDEVAAKIDKLFDGLYIPPADPKQE